MTLKYNRTFYRDSLDKAEALLGLSIISVGVNLMRRSTNDIAADILKAAMNGSTKTHIISEVNLNFNIAQKYLELLNEKGLIRQENGLFVTTKKGKIFHEIAKEFKL